MWYYICPFLTLSWAMTVGFVVSIDVFHLGFACMGSPKNRTSRCNSPKWGISHWESKNQLKQTQVIDLRDKYRLGLEQKQICVFSFFTM